MGRPKGSKEILPDDLIRARPSPHPHQPALGSPPREGVGAALPGAQEGSESPGWAKVAGCAASQDSR
jgi:hypothetical protein